MFSSLRCVTVVIRLTVRSLEVITSTLLEIKFTSDDISADYINQCNCNTTRYSTLHCRWLYGTRKADGFVGHQR